MIRFACPGCSAMFTVEDEKAGKSGKCPKCQTQFIIPAAELAPTEFPLTEDPAAPLPPPPAPPPGADRPPPLPFPPPAPTAGPNDPVEIQPCPKCRSRLSVLPTDLGLDIECPSCKEVYKANRADAPPPPSSAGDKSGPRGSLVRLGSGVREEDEKDDDRDDRRDKRRSKRRDDDEDDYDRRRSRRRDDDDDRDDDRRGRRYSRRYDDDDDYDRRSRLAPHRGGMVLTFGIVGLVFCWTVVGLLFSVLAWVFGSQDLKAMDDGRMDESGRSSTNTGKILGMVTVILFCCLVALRCGLVFLQAGLR